MDEPTSEVKGALQRKTLDIDIKDATVDEEKGWKQGNEENPHGEGE